MLAGTSTSSDSGDAVHGGAPHHASRTTVHRPWPPTLMTARTTRTMMSQKSTDPVPPDSDAPVASGDELERLREENEALRTRLTRRRSRRRWLAGVLVVLTVVTATVATVEVWAHRTLTDTDRFMEVAEPAITDPAFTAVLRDTVVEASLEALDLEARAATLLEDIDASLSAALLEAVDPDPRVLEALERVERPTLAMLAPAISEALEARVVDTVDAFITSEALQSRLPGLVRQAHSSGVALLYDDLTSIPNVYLEGGEVRLDLVPLVVEALEQVRAELGSLLPDVTLPAVVAGGCSRAVSSCATSSRRPCRPGCRTTSASSR